jgi:hypothetical protein
LDDSKAARKADCLVALMVAAKAARWDKHWVVLTAVQREMKTADLTV